MAYTIGQLGRLTGTKVPTIRYYETVGLLEPVGRSEGGQRRYDEPARQRLGFVRHARDMGFSLDAIRQLLALADRPAASCEAVDGIVREQLGEVERRLAILGSIRAELARMLVECDGGTVGRCRILEVLGDHSLCLADGRRRGVADRLDMFPTCKDHRCTGTMVQMRHVPDDIHRALTSRAALEGLSLSDHLLREIQAIASRPGPGELHARLSSRPRTNTSESMAEAVRAERDAR